MLRRGAEGRSRAAGGSARAGEASGRRRGRGRARGAAPGGASAAGEGGWKCSIPQLEVELSQNPKSRRFAEPNQPSPRLARVAKPSLFHTSHLRAMAAMLTSSFAGVQVVAKSANRTQRAAVPVVSCSAEGPAKFARQVRRACRTRGVPPLEISISHLSFVGSTR